MNFDDGEGKQKSRCNRKRRREPPPSSAAVLTMIEKRGYDELRP